MRLEIERHCENLDLLPSAAVVLLDRGRNGLRPCGLGFQGVENPDSEEEKGPGKGGNGTEEGGRAGEQEAGGAVQQPCQTATATEEADKAGLSRKFWVQVCKHDGHMRSVASCGQLHASCAHERRQCL